MPSNFNVTVGADPEFLVIEKGRIVPACRKFGGEKRAPIFISPDGGYLEDGVTVEFNVTTSKTLAETRKKIENLLLVFTNKHASYTIAHTTAHQFDTRVLNEFPEALAIGCSPDMSAYGLRLAPDIKKFDGYRFAGGHIHIGISPWPEGLMKTTFIKFLDLLLLGPFSFYSDARRWEFYGHPGLYRETSYGVEYRSPDNTWCNPAFMSRVDVDVRAWWKNQINSFDESLHYFKEIIDHDGHGARINDELENIIEESGVNDAMGTIAFTQGAHKFRGFKHWATDLHHYLQGWHKTRLRAKSLKAEVEGAA